MQNRLIQFDSYRFDSCGASETSRIPLMGSSSAAKAGVLQSVRHKFLFSSFLWASGNITRATRRVLSYIAANMANHITKDMLYPKNPGHKSSKSLEIPYGLLRPEIPNNFLWEARTSCDLGRKIYVPTSDIKIFVMRAAIFPQATTHTANSVFYFGLVG
jgi:hypothetical protein